MIVNTNLRNDNGSILIDTLVAILVCAILLASLSPFFSRIIKLQSNLINEIDELVRNSANIW